MLTRSEPSEHDSQREKSQQQQYHGANLARIDGFNCQTTEDHEQAQRYPHSPRRSRSHIHLPNPWCTGEDSNLRSSKERQIYSLLPLTARPPVHIADRRCGLTKSNSTERLSTPTHSADAFPRSQRKPGRQFGMIAAGYSGPKLWSWRRDLNPRPSDYKSDALPAELRQPEQPCSLPKSAGSQLPRLPQNPAQLWKRRRRIRMLSFLD